MKSVIFFRNFCVGLGFLALAGGGPAGGVASTISAPAYLRTAPSSIATRNPIRLTVRAAGYRLARATNRFATFGDHPYAVSLAALIGRAGVVMVHAETVRDRSGASNYDDLPAAAWPKSGFRMRNYCTDITPATVAEEHDLAFLQRHRWDPTGTLAVEQYLITTADHNAEVVISLVVRGVDCAKPAMVKARLDALRARVVVTAR